VGNPKGFPRTVGRRRSRLSTVRQSHSLPGHAAAEYLQTAVAGVADQQAPAVEPGDTHRLHKLTRFRALSTDGIDRRIARARPPGDVAEAFDPAEFLVRVIMHIPEPRRHLVRYYGAYSNVSRGKRRRQTETAIGVSPCDSEQAPSARADRDHSPDARALRRSWAQLIKRVYEVDPLVCPSCGGEMRIIAFIIDHDVVDAILRHLAKAEARSPRGPPSAAALSAVS